MNQQEDLSRFTEAHKRSYQIALREIKSGHKTTHWMWYVFPLIQGLTRSSTSNYYALCSLDEAAMFLRDPYLGGNLVEICHALLELETNNPTEVFGKPDDWKLKCSMTLFSQVEDSNPVFQQVLDKYFGGKCNYRTLRLLGIM